MGFLKKDWKARKGEGLNKFSIDGAAAVSLVNTPTNITESGDAFCTQNMNNLEDRVETAVDTVETLIVQNYQTLPTVIYDPNIEELNWNFPGGFRTTKTKLFLDDYDIIEAHFEYGVNNLENTANSVILRVPIIEVRKIINGENGGVSVFSNVEFGNDGIYVGLYTGKIGFTVERDPVNGDRAYRIVVVIPNNGDGAWTSTRIVNVYGIKRVPLEDIPSINLDSSLLTETQHGNILKIVDTDSKKLASINSIERINILNYHDFNLNANIGVYEPSTGTITLENITQISNSAAIGYFVLEKGKRYNFSLTFAGSIHIPVGKYLFGIYTRVGGMGVSGHYLANDDNRSKNKSFVFTYDTQECYMLLNRNPAPQGVTFTDFIISNILLEEGATQSDFEPYIDDGEAVVVTTTTGNNLLNFGEESNWVISYPNWTIFDEDLQKITFTNSSGDTSRVQNTLNIVNVNKTMYISGISLSYQARVMCRCFDGNGNNISESISISGWNYNVCYEAVYNDSNIGSFSVSLNLPANVAYVNFGFIGKGSLSTSNPQIYSELQVSFEMGSYDLYQGESYNIIFPLAKTMNIKQYKGVTNISISKGVMDVTASIDSNVVTARHLNGVYASRPTDVKPYPRYFIATDAIIPSAGARQSFLEKNKSGTTDWIKIV